MVFSMRNVLALACVTAVASAESTMSRHLQVINFRQELLDAVNAERKAQDLELYCLNELLMNAAQVQANDMAENNFIKSTGSDGSTPGQRATDQGFEGASVTEVVGAGYRSAESIVAAWTKSASAKKAMLGKYTVMGPGYTFDKTRKFVHYWAVDFAEGECGNATSTGVGSGSLDSNATVGSTSGSGIPTSSTGSGSTDLPTSGSGSAPATSTAGSAPAASTSGSGEAPATSSAGSAPAASTSGSDEAPATSSAGSAPQASTSGSGGVPPASGSGEVPPAASGSGEVPPAASGSGEAPGISTSGSAPAASTAGSGEAPPATPTTGSAPAASTTGSGAAPATSTSGSAPAESSGWDDPTQ